jgi:ATP-dependent RNA helicase DeaD
MIGSTIKPARIPTASDIASKRRAIFQESLLETLRGGGFEAHLASVSDLSEEFDTAQIAAAALHMLWQSENSDKAAVGEEMVHDIEQPELGMVRIFVGMGRQDGLRPADLVGAIAHEAGLVGKTIGVIDILDRVAFVEVPAASGEVVVEALRRSKIRNRKVKVQLAHPTNPAETAPERTEQFDAPRGPRRFNDQGPDRGPRRRH